MTAGQQDQLVSLAQTYRSNMAELARKRRPLLSVLEATTPVFLDCAKQSRDSIQATDAAHKLQKLLVQEEQVHAEYLATTLDKVRFQSCDSCSNQCLVFC